MKPFTPPPARITQLLVALCVVIEALCWLAGTRFDERLMLIAGLIPARITGAVGPLPGAMPAWLTPVTAMFLHGGWLHLFFNMSFLAWIGRYVEWVVGWWRYLLLYFVGGIVGGLLQVAVAPASVMPVVGASGAIAAVFGCYAVVFARSRAGARKVLGISLSSDTVTALWYAAVWIGLQFLTAFAFNDGGMQIAIWTHIGGFLTGLLFAQPFARGPRVE